MRAMKFLEKWYYIPILLVLFLLALGRSRLYGDLSLSVPTRDTASFVSSSEAPALSWEAMTGRRLFTTNLLYKLFTPSQGYPQLTPSVDTAWREVYPGFDSLARFQSVLSILGWGVLALSFASKVQNNFLKILSVLLILLFGFSPPVGDWDSVLGAESISFSLFALSLGLLILLVFAVYPGERIQFQTIALAVAWFIVFFLWSFARDVNLYAMFITFVMVLILPIASRQFRRSRVAIALGLALFAAFALGLVTSMQSERSSIQIEHAIFEYVLPYPARAEYLENLGMPPPESPEFKTWFDKYAPISYMSFLLTHPRFTLSHYLHGTYVAFDPYLQSYFRATNLEWRAQLEKIGASLHPNMTALVVGIILLAVLWAYALKDKGSGTVSKPWTWLASWVFLTGMTTLFISIFGDTVALHRHAIFSTTELRLLMWLLIIILSDLLLARKIGRESPVADKGILESRTVQ